MRIRSIVAALAVTAPLLVLESMPAAACDWGWGYRDTSYTAAPSYGYAAPRTYGYYGYTPRSYGYYGYSPAYYGGYGLYGRRWGLGWRGYGWRGYGFRGWRGVGWRGARVAGFRAGVRAGRR
jgi:hypothetical protein